MNRHRLALAALLSTALLAAGCGSDDDDGESAGGGNAAPAQAEQAGASGDAKPKASSARGRMIDCIESELGFEVEPGDDPNNLEVKNDDGKLQGNVVIHDDVAAARRAVAATLSKGTNAATFGRVEFIRRAANDTASGTIATCVSVQYNMP